MEGNIENGLTEGFNSSKHVESWGVCSDCGPLDVDLGGRRKVISLGQDKGRSINHFAESSVSNREIY